MPLQIPVERVEALLLWQDPYVSAKVFGAGLYILICLRHLVCGETSAVAALGAMLLLIEESPSEAWKGQSMKSFSCQLCQEAPQDPCHGAPSTSPTGPLQ